MASINDNSIAVGVSTTEQFCLRWNSYLGNLGTIFPQLLENQCFIDVTIACEGEKLHCHKLVLAACSMYFESLLEDNPCKHPIIILPHDVKLWEIRALIDFMYRGEVNVSQDRISDLLKCAKMLKIRGLCAFNSSASNLITKFDDNEQQQQQQEEQEILEEDDFDDEDEQTEEEMTPRVEASKEENEDNFLEENHEYAVLDHDYDERNSFISDSDRNIEIKKEPDDNEELLNCDKPRESEISPSPLSIRNEYKISVKKFASEMNRNLDENEMFIEKSDSKKKRKKSTNLHLKSTLKSSNQTDDDILLKLPSSLKFNRKSMTIFVRNQCETNTNSIEKETGDEFRNNLPEISLSRGEIDHFINRMKKIRYNCNYINTNESNKDQPEDEEQQQQELIIKTEPTEIISNGNYENIVCSPNVLDYPLNSDEMKLNEIAYGNHHQLQQQQHQQYPQIDRIYSNRIATVEEGKKLYKEFANIDGEDKTLIESRLLNRIYHENRQYSSIQKNISSMVPSSSSSSSSSLLPSSVELLNLNKNEKDVLLLSKRENIARFCSSKAKMSKTNSNRNGCNKTNNKNLPDNLINPGLSEVILRSPRSNQPRSYSTEALYAALMDVKSGESIYRASQQHKVPRKTLRNWMKRWHIKSAYPMPKQLKQAAERKKLHQSAIITSNINSNNNNNNNINNNNCNNEDDAIK